MGVQRPEPQPGASGFTVNGGAAFGGTPDDQSVAAAIKDLKARGLQVCLTPFILMDIPAGNTLPDPYSGGTGQAAIPGADVSQSNMRRQTSRRKLRQKSRRSWRNTAISSCITPTCARLQAAWTCFCSAPSCAA